MTQNAPGESPVVTPSVDTPAQGIRTWRNSKNGFRVVDLHYEADPKKRDPNWVTEAKTGMPTAQWNREYGSQWIVYDGKPVYADFDPALHIARGTILAPKRARLVSGWDAGPNDVNLAWCLGIVSMQEPRVTIIDEYQVDDGDVEDFVQAVGSRLQLEWFKLGGFSLHVVDQSVFTKSSIVQKAVADVMRQHGMSPIPGEISFAKRRVGVERLLKTVASVDGSRVVMSLMIHERCGFLIEGLMGGYAYGKAFAATSGEYKETPLKNQFSHIANAMEYICSRLGVAGATVPFEGRPLPSGSLV